MYKIIIVETEKKQHRHRHHKERKSDNGPERKEHRKHHRRDPFTTEKIVARAIKELPPRGKREHAIPTNPWFRLSPNFEPLVIAGYLRISLELKPEDEVPVLRKLLKYWKLFSENNRKEARIKQLDYILSGNRIMGFPLFIKIVDGNQKKIAKTDAGINVQILRMEANRALGKNTEYEFDMKDFGKEFTKENFEQALILLFQKRIRCITIRTVEQK